MKKKLIVTLTTVHGSRQYTLNQLTKYVLAIFLVGAAVSFFVSNFFLVKTADELVDLVEDHQVLTEQYDLMVGSQALQQAEADQLSKVLADVTLERDKLQEENIRIGELNENLDSSLYGLEELLGMEHVEEMTPERADMLQATARQRLHFLSAIPNGLPIQGKRINDGFGMRFHPVRKKKVMHNGMDFKADIGTPVYATADGVVEFAGYNKRSGFGKLIILQHSFGFRTYFAHLNNIYVKNGDFIHKGQKIGASGNTGISTGPHLHYEVRRLYQALDPAPFVAWNITNFDSIFSDVKKVKWASLNDLYPLNQVAQP
mgnify:CR=1 FL=1